MSHFHRMFQMQMAAGRHLCVGLDPDELPVCLTGTNYLKTTVWAQDIVRATSHIAAAFKPNLGFYLAMGGQGINALVEICRMIREEAPDTPIILDGKFGDIGNTCRANATFAFEECHAHAVTVNLYLGREALAPFLDRGDKGILVVCRTSNPGAGEFQDLPINQHVLYMHIAAQVTKNWNKHVNCGLVIGATAPRELAIIRSMIPNMPILIPGVGRQGGNITQAVHAVRSQDTFNFLVNVSSGIGSASKDDDYAEAAKVAAESYHHQITEAMKG